MPWPVYSERFLWVTEGNTLFTYQVPLGQRAIVTHVIAANLVAEPNRMAVTLQNLPIWLHDYPAQVGVDYIETRIPVYGGEQLAAATSAEPCSLIVAGYQFNDPSRAARAAGALEREPLGELAEFLR